MTHCPFNHQLEAYHDGELDSGRRAQIEQHLVECPACAAELAQIQNISRAFAEAPSPRLSQISMHRLHANLDLLLDRGLLRLARVLSGVAAVIVLSGSVWLVMHSRPTTPTPGSEISMVLEMEEQAAPTADPTPSDWIVAQLGR